MSNTLFRFVKASADSLPKERRKPYFVLMGDSLEHGTLWPDKFKEWDVRFYLSEVTEQDSTWNDHLDSIGNICMYAPIHEPDRRHHILKEVKSKFTLIPKQ